LAEIFGMFAADGCLQDDYICIWGNIRGVERVEDRMKKIGFSKHSKQIKYEIWKKNLEFVSQTLV